VNVLKQLTSQAFVLKYYNDLFKGSIKHM